MTLRHASCFQDDPEIPFTEEDYRRRKPHPNFKEHNSAEKTVMKLGKTVSV
jgi:adenylate kinase